MSFGADFKYPRNVKAALGLLVFLLGKRRFLIEQFSSCNQRLSFKKHQFGSYWGFEGTFADRIRRESFESYHLGWAKSSSQKLCLS